MVKSIAPQGSEPRRVAGHGSVGCLREVLEGRSNLPPVGPTFTLSVGREVGVLALALEPRLLWRAKRLRGSL